MVKSDEQLMLKALKLLPELQGLTVLEALRTLDMAGGMLKQLQEVNISDLTLQATLQEWQVAASQFKCS